MAESLESITTKEIAKQYARASIHFGHNPKEWNPKMAPYILFEKYGYHIIDLVKTRKFLKLAGNILQKKAEKGGKFLFVGTTKIASIVIPREVAKLEKNRFYITHRWLGGMLTNWRTVQKQIQKLKDLEKQDSQKDFENLSKKEYFSQRKEIDKLKRMFDGIKNMTTLPDLVIFTNQLKDSLAIQECLKLGIPTICIVDTNCDPDLIPYPIPGNDDSSASLTFILKYLVSRISIGYNKITN